LTLIFVGVAAFFAFQMLLRAGGPPHDRPTSPVHDARLTSAWAPRRSGLSLVVGSPVREIGSVGNIGVVVLFAPLGRPATWGAGACARPRLVSRGSSRCHWQYRGSGCSLSPETQIARPGGGPGRAFSVRQRPVTRRLALSGMRLE
jgi:hypothetical protein